MTDDADRADGSPWWKPVPLTWALWALAGWCCALGRVGLHTRITDSDPAGNGIGTGMVQGFAMLGLIAAAILAGVYLLIRWAPVRHVCVGLLLAVGVMMIPLVR